MEQESQLLPLNTIRCETVLSRYPIHNLAKQRSAIDIDIKKLNERGDVELQWEVSYNSKYGQPRQLAYKLDTVVINRHIEEAGRPVPEIIRLGSLRDIATQLGLSHHDSQTLKRAFRQNAFVGISAKLRYKDRRGVERTLEADFTRYDVIFSGEELRDGRKADAVHLILSRVQREVLNNAPARPLDYDYLKTLSPASQRFYEVLSYRIFATLKNKLPTADIAYSEYCMYSAQERYFTWEEVKKQMYKLHKPHTKSGYIAGMSHDAVWDNEGKSDWLLRYTPGPKAKAEYRTFTSKGKRDHAIDVELESAAPRTLPEPPQELTLTPLTDDEQKHIEELTISFGVSIEKSEILVRAYPLAVKLQLEVFPYRNKKPKDRAGWIIKAIEQSYPAPPDYEERRRREEAKLQAEQETRLRNARSRHEDAHRAAYLGYGPDSGQNYHIS